MPNNNIFYASNIFLNKTDEEIVEIAKQDNKEAIEFIMEKYKELVRVIFEKPMVKKPDLGQPPKWLDEPMLDTRLNLFGELYDDDLMLPEEGKPETTTFHATDEFEDKIDLSGIDIPDSLRDDWNFHGDIALHLEMKARHIYGDKDRPYTKIYDADGIEGGKFAEVMIDLLHEKTGRESGRDDIDEFIKICSQYIGKTGYEIDHRVAQGLIDRFDELMES